MSLPDDLAEQVKRAAGGEGQVSAYVAAALADYQERVGLDEILAGWQVETPLTVEVRRRVGVELDQVGITRPPGDQQTAG